MSAEDGGELSWVLAKSATGSGLGRPELLTEHSIATRDAARALAARIGRAGVLARCPQFWPLAEYAALLHDTGKIAEGFQRQLQQAGQRWGERHEVLSLAYVDLLTAGFSARDRAMVAAGVAFHHRCLSGNGRSLREMYPAAADWLAKFGRHPDPAPGRPEVQVAPARHTALLGWLAGQLSIEAPPPGGLRLWERARNMFATLTCNWAGPIPADDGLLAVLMQGAVTLADHAASAHVPLQRHMPVPFGYLSRLTGPYPHQRAAGTTDGHLVLIAPTGSGKTEGGLAWASRQLESMPGEPRLIWLLPYRASIDAVAVRFRAGLDPAPGDTSPDVGVLHATAAASLLQRAVADDCAPSPGDARKARATAGAMRLFAQRVRVATPHQLLRAAIAGPRYASVLLEQANAVIVLDELHAYEPATFGRICAAMRLWEGLGSRVAVLSATLGPPMTNLITASLSDTVTVHRAPAGTAPDRHRLVIDDQLITDPASLDRIRSWLERGHSVLAVANTVSAAQRLYREMLPAADRLFPGDDTAALLLHSRFRLCDRAKQERRIKLRHPERGPGEPGNRRGGLVVATQALEVSLCLDFDRGITELAPIEAIAQRAGRVNRRGHHPDGPVEFRVHAVESHLPYDEGAIGAALLALRTCPGPVISEETIGNWLTCAYATDWGQRWATAARHHRDLFSESFLTFTEPFHDRSEFAAKLDESFDTTDVLLASDVKKYQELATGPNGDPLLAAGLLIPIRWTQRAALQRAGRAGFDPSLDIWVVDAPYDPRTGLDLASHSARPAPETIL